MILPCGFICLFSVAVSLLAPKPLQTEQMQDKRQKQEVRLLKSRCINQESCRIDRLHLSLSHFYSLPSMALLYVALTRLPKLKRWASAYFPCLSIKTRTRAKWLGDGRKASEGSCMVLEWAVTRIVCGRTCDRRVCFTSKKSSHTACVYCSFAIILYIYNIYT